MERNDTTAYAEEYNPCLQDALESFGDSDLAVPEIDKVDYFPVWAHPASAGMLGLSIEQSLQIAKAQHEATKYDPLPYDPTVRGQTQAI
jgi:hypothetical protein